MIRGTVFKLTALLWVSSTGFLLIRGTVSKALLVVVTGTLSG